jgi:proline iminopeptidase
MFSVSEPFHTGTLTMADGQDLYWEQSGNPEGLPALYLHGGPGGGLGTGRYRSRFDPDLFCVTGLEQRGCGRSTPLAGHPGHDLDRNTTQQLLVDVEALRSHLGVEAWLLHGVSWGSTLALAYAQEHPERVLGMVLMAVTTTSRREVDWVTEHIGAVYPEAWDRFAGFAESAGVGYRRGEGRLVEAYAALLRHADSDVRRAAASSWAEWEDTHVAIGAGGYRRDPRWLDESYVQAFATLTTHYWAHDGFLDPPVLSRMERLHGIPAVLVHGRRDVSGPVVTAWSLHRSWPGSELVIDEGEGHGGQSMAQSCADATTRLARQLR